MRYNTTYYGFSFKDNRNGELEFLCSTQSHTTTSKILLKREIQDAIKESDNLTMNDIEVVELKRIKL